MSTPADPAPQLRPESLCAYLSRTWDPVHLVESPRHRGIVFAPPGGGRIVAVCTDQRPDEVVDAVISIARAEGRAVDAVRADVARAAAGAT